MIRSLLALTALLFALSACSTTTPQLDAEGRPLPQVYRIRAEQEDEIQFRMLDGVNALRQSAGVQPVQLNAQLIAAAATHSRDMSVQNRPWNFGSDGSSPIDRVRRAGYPGRLIGENISESYESELETLAAWNELPDARRTIIDPAATDLGIAWYQEENGKIWWTLLTGARSGGGLTG